MFAHEVLDDISVTTFGLVDVGKGELSLKYLRSLYDAVFLCHGASQSKLLEIPLVNADGTDVSRACSSPILTAQQVVGWYNGDWEETKRDLALDCVQDVVIVGAGNVAIDIARILLKVGGGVVVVIIEKKEEVIYLFLLQGPCHVSFY